MDSDSLRDISDTQTLDYASDASDDIVDDMLLYFGHKVKLIGDTFVINIYDFSIDERDNAKFLGNFSDYLTFSIRHNINPVMFVIELGGGDTEELSFEIDYNETTKLVYIYNISTYHIPVYLNIVCNQNDDGVVIFNLITNRFINDRVDFEIDDGDTREDIGDEFWPYGDDANYTDFSNFLLDRFFYNL